MLKKKGNYKKTASKFAYFKNFLYLCPRLRIGWEPPREGGGKERTYIHKRRNWTFCIWRCENFATSNCLSKTKQRGRPKGGIVYSRELASGDFLVARFLMVNYIMTRRGAFSVVRSDRQGNAKTFTSWNERQNWLHVFCIYPGRIIKNQSKGSCFDFILRTIYKDEEKLIFAMLPVAIVDFM